jgi:speckle-type POZ protein
MTLSSPSRPPQNPSASSKEVADDVEDMYEEEEFTDFGLKCSDGEVLSCHKFILAARSPVFRAMLKINMKEAKQGSADVPDFDSKIMREVLRFIYCGFVFDIDEMSQDLVFAAEKYELEGLKKLCIDNMISMLSSANVLQFITIADRVSNGKRLLEECMEVVTT